MRVQLLRTAFPDRPVLDMAVSDALLRRVAAGEHAPVTRLYRPGPTMAFGRLDALAPGFGAACEAAQAHGFTPLVRLGGGHAAAYDARALVYEEIRPAGDVTAGLQPRFRAATELIAGALRAVGADARIGPLPGEYCAGEHSVNVAGRIKVAGTAQRAVRGAALVTAVVIVGGGADIRAALEDVYRALGIAWAPSTAGALEDRVPGVSVEAVEGALLAQAGEPFEAAELDAATLELAQGLVARHEPLRAGRA